MPAEFKGRVNLTRPQLVTLAVAVQLALGRIDEDDRLLFKVAVNEGRQTLETGLTDGSVISQERVIVLDPDQFGDPS